MPSEMMTINTHVFPFELDIVPNIFKPNTTTEVFIAQLGQLHGKTVLDLGCGAGPISIAAALAGADRVYAGDIMHLACVATQANVRKNGVDGRVFVKQGHLFEPFSPMEFDLIVCDVSGIADDVARICILPMIPGYVEWRKVTGCARSRMWSAKVSVLAGATIRPRK